MIFFKLLEEKNDNGKNTGEKRHTWQTGYASTTNNVLGTGKSLSQSQLGRTLTSQGVGRGTLSHH